MTTIPEHPVTLKGGEAATIRTADVADAAQLVGMAEAMYEDQEGVVGEPGENSWSVEGEVERIERANSSDDRLAIVAAVGDTVVGQLAFRLGDRARLRHQGEFFIGVAPDWRGRGVGRCLLTSLITWAEARGIERIGLTVLGNAERAIGLYRSLGFEEEGRRIRQVRFGPDHYADQVQMAMFLGDRPY